MFPMSSAGNLCRRPVEPHCTLAGLLIDVLAWPTEPPDESGRARLALLSTTVAASLTPEGLQGLQPCRTMLAGFSLRVKEK